MKVGRREFLSGAAAGVATLLAPRAARAAESRIEVLAAEPIGTILPDVYGHFVEHLGAVVYDGIWVGERSKVRNVDGMRAELVEAMRRISPPVVRYPGGCFADSYDWRDGVGPRASRPRRAAFWSDAPETNRFGTNEFLRFCRLTGARPYLAANLRSLPAQAFSEWVEYCNAPAGSTTHAERRASGEAGSREPFGVRFWGVGNETWGCGGNLTAREYATEYRRFTAAVPRYGVDLAFVAAGPASGDLAWTRGFFEGIAEKGEGMFGSVYAFALHHYSWNVSMGATDDWEKGKGDALDFDVAQWYELLREGDRVEALVRDHWAVMGEYDRRHRVKIAVDEWGAWHRPGTAAHPSHTLGQASTLRDALLAGLTLDAFNRHADKVVMGNVAQLVNCLQALFLAHEERFVLTPTYHVFEMYAPHQGAQAVRALFSAPPAKYTRAGAPATFWGLNGSASLRDRRLTLTVVNPDAAEPRDAEVVVRGAAVRSARARTLTADDIHAHNSFERPRALEPRDAEVRAGAGPLVFRFPKASVTRLDLEL